MKCYYEVLEITNKADDAEIKSAYRKQALKWHPDKNPDNPAFAKEQFQVVQQAYEVLSDRQERAWYDLHRAQILKAANPEDEDQDKSLDVFQYFTTSCFKGYSDDPKGFYSVYRKVFEDIAQEDMKYMEEKEDFVEIPSFGRSDTEYEAVKAFYDHWMNYCTKKSYSWLDPYDIQEGKGDRRLMKMIDKENKKVRQKARKERNEEIRNLVAFVRKRDKRVQAYRKEQEVKSLEKRKKQEEARRQRRLEQQQLHAGGQQAEWLKFDNVKSELEEIERHLAAEFGDHLSQSEDEDNLYCVACNKVFKTPKAFENHELSKKHRENVEKLRATMMEEEEDLTEDDELDDYNDKGGGGSELEENGVEGINEDESPDESLGGDGEENISELNDLDQGQSQKKKKKLKKRAALATFQAEDSDLEVEEAPPQPVDDSKTIKIKNRRSKKKPEAPSKDLDLDKEIKPVRRLKKGKQRYTEEEQVLDVSHCCVTCKTTFPSKNKLFDHLKKMNHGVYLPKGKPNSNRKN